MGYIETHATADVSIMLVGCKRDLDDYREVQTEEGRKVNLFFMLGLLRQIGQRRPLCQEWFFNVVFYNLKWTILMDYERMLTLDYNTI